MRLGLSVALLLGLSAAAPSVRADEVDVCSDAFVAAQRLKATRPIAAREKAVVCARDVCPQALRRECVAWLGPLEDAIPTVAVRVRDSHGCDVDGVPLTVDGSAEPRADGGRSFALEPGTHVFQAVLRGSASIEQTVVLTAGQKNREVVLSDAPAGMVCGAKEPLASTPVYVTRRPAPGTLYLFGTLAGLGLVTWAVAGGIGLSEQNDLATCRPRCDPSDVSRARSTLLVADLGAAVGLVSLAIGVVLYFTRPAIKDRVAVGPSGVGVRF